MLIPFERQIQAHTDRRYAQEDARCLEVPESATLSNPGKIRYHGGGQDDYAEPDGENTRSLPVFQGITSSSLGLLHDPNESQNGHVQNLLYTNLVNPPLEKGENRI